MRPHLRWNIWRLTLLGIYTLSGLMMTAQAHAHGGVPGVLKLIPPQQSPTEPFWVVDTLGLFRGEADTVSDAASTQPSTPRAWSWLCDDAVDPTLGVDALLVLDEQTLVAVARSGVYRSVDQGCTFDRLDSQINEHTIGGISAHPTDPAELTIFTNSMNRENRVWWSDDRGATWSPSDLLIEGGIFGLWRDPESPADLWVNHAQGLSRSRDGGRSFETLSDVNYSGASPYGVRLLGGARLDDHVVLWASLDHYPTSSLLVSYDGGHQWREIHQLNDRYDQLALTPEALWISAPFEGLFIYPLTEAERRGSEESWTESWTHRPELRVSCLTPDPLEPSALWACGRMETTGWLVARTADLGETWSTLMTGYQEAADGAWGCAPSSQSVMACATRCLDAECDPSRNMSVMGDDETLDGDPPSSAQLVDMGGQGSEGERAADAPMSVSAPDDVASSAGRSSGASGCQALIIAPHVGAWLFALLMGLMWMRRSRRWCE